MITVASEVTKFGTIQHCELSNRTHAQCLAQAAKDAGCEVETHTSAGLYWVEFYASEDVFVAVNRAAENEFHARMMPDAAPVVPVAAPVAVKPIKVRCAHYLSIKTFFAVARDAGLDTTATSRDRVRGALGVFVGRRLASRNEVTGPEWSGAAQAIKTGRLFW
jgi:hypothetical protein